MSKIICKICGAEENSERWIPSAAQELEELQMCNQCYHWYLQHRLDLEERGEYGHAIVEGQHYTLLPATNGYFQGFGGRKFTFEFNDGTRVECSNVWYQGEIPEGYWREKMPNNAKIISS